MADIIFFAKKKQDADDMFKVPSIKEMRELIINAITIDDFIKYQNGNLVEDFLVKEQSARLNIKKYNSSKLYKKINFKNKEETMYFYKVASSFENFKNFMKDDGALIDHTYLWDIMSSPNEHLFPQGVNLVILQLPDNDITNNVQLICPTNHYSTKFYQPKKPTIIILKEEGYYEPIYSLEIKARFQEKVPFKNIRLISKNKEMKAKGIMEGSRVKTTGHPSQPGYSMPAKVIKIDHVNETADLIHDPYKESIIKEFKEYDKNLSRTMRSVFKELIKPFFEQVCRPLESMPNVYKAKRPLLLYNMVEKLDKYDYEIKHFIMNFNNKIIGIVAKEPTGQQRNGFIPCYPSALDDNLKKDINVVFMNDFTIWNDYTNTVQFLNKLHNRSNRKNSTDQDIIPCKPAFKIIEDEFIVGILTETDQFIQINQPLLPSDIEPELDLPSITDQDYVIQSREKTMPVDVLIATQNSTDTEREDYIKRIKLETGFYNVFRNSIRILLNNYENHKIREELEKEINNYFVLYNDKLENIKLLLKKLVGEKIKFIGDKNFYKLVNEVSTCIIKDKTKCNNSPNICITENDKCNMILPIKNLISGKENEPVYFGKMADELIRFNRIKSFMLEPQTYLSFGNIGYNLKEDEVILIQSLLSQEYFEMLIPTIENKYVQHNSHDESQPILTQYYDNKITSLSQANEEENNICVKTDNAYIKSSIWKSIFPANYYETEYGKTCFCTFALIIDLIENKTGEKLTMNNIKNILYDEYKKYLLQYKNKIVDILILEGKKTLGDQVHSENLSFINMLYMDNYYLTPFDYWLLIVKYQIPSLFISQKPIALTKPLKDEQTDFVAYIDVNKTTIESLTYIIVPGLRPETIPGYKIVKSSEKEENIKMDDLKPTGVKKVEDAFERYIEIIEYLERSELTKKTVKKRAKKLLIGNNDTDIEDADEDDNIAGGFMSKKSRKQRMLKSRNNKTKRRH